MKTVFKYPVGVSDKISVFLPAGSKPLRFDWKDGMLCLWARVDRDSTAPDKEYVFRMAGTGHDIEDEFSEYINTAFLDELVFHFFWLP